MRRVAPGNYESPDGQYRVVRINDYGAEQWQAQARVTARGNWWSWMTTTRTKREAMEVIPDAPRH